MSTTAKFISATGSFEMTGIPVSNGFDYRSFALENGFNHTYIDSIRNTSKYGGVGFYVAKNFSPASDIPYYLKKTLEVLFVNELPVMYRIITND